MLTSLRHRDSPCANLARLMTCWLVVVLLLQGLASLQNLVRGPVHGHAAGAAARLSDEAVSVFTHAPRQPQSAASTQVQAHALAHAQGQAHHHGADDVVLPVGGEASLQSALDAAASALLCTLVALGMSYAWRAQAMRAAPLATPGWTLAERDLAPPRKPPRG